MEKSEKLLIKEISQMGHQMQRTLRHLSIGQLIGMIRRQLGMSQKDLSMRTKIPQATLSRIEKGKQSSNIRTLNNILGAMSCDLLLVPMLRIPIDVQKRKQAEAIAKKNIRYLKGTMSLEEQKPDEEFTNELEKEETENLLKSKKLWRR